MNGAAIPCRAGCALACPIDTWSHHVFNDDHPHPPSWRLGHAVSWGWIPPESWAGAFEQFEATYGRPAMLDALSYLAKDAPRSRTFNAEHQRRIATVLAAYRRQVAA